MEPRCEATLYAKCSQDSPNPIGATASSMGKKGCCVLGAEELSGFPPYFRWAHVTNVDRDLRRSGSSKTRSCFPLWCRAQFATSPE
jgi:hypothetical protein